VRAHTTQTAKVEQAAADNSKLEKKNEGLVAKLDEMHKKNEKLMSALMVQSGQVGRSHREEEERREAVVKT
jgi:hypothetical protein